MDAPDKIYVSINTDTNNVVKVASDKPWPNGEKYIRADLYEQLQQENAELMAQIEAECIVSDSYRNERDELKAQLQQREGE